MVIDVSHMHDKTLGILIVGTKIIWGVSKKIRACSRCYASTLMKEFDIFYSFLEIREAIYKILDLFFSI